jgi:hypothetical protein
MSPQAFKELAKSLLDASDGALLDMVSLDPRPSTADGGRSYADTAPSSGSDFIDNWREWERVLRLNLAKQRALKTKREGAVTVEPPVVPADASAAALRAITAMESPLEAEVLIDKARWSAIDALQGIEPFDRKVVFAYLLKLFILQRHDSFQAETGFSEYKSIYASILESAQTGTSRAGESK